MSLDWNRNGKLDAADYFITEMLDRELEVLKEKNYSMRKTEKQRKIGLKEQNYAAI